MIRGPPSQVGSVAQSQVRHALTEGSGGSNNQPGRWRNSSRADSSNVRSLEIALNSLSPEESGARVGTTSGQGGDAETGATFFDNTRRASGRSSCEGGQVEKAHWRGPMVWRWMQSRKPLSKPKLPPTRSQCQSRSQIARVSSIGPRSDW